MAVSEIKQVSISISILVIVLLLSQEASWGHFLPQARSYVAFINDPTFYWAVTAVINQSIFVINIVFWLCLMTYAHDLFCWITPLNWIELLRSIFPQSFLNLPPRSPNTERRTENKKERTINSSFCPYLCLDSNLGPQRERRMTYQCAISPRQAWQKTSKLFLGGGGHKFLELILKTLFEDLCSTGKNTRIALFWGNWILWPQSKKLFQKFVQTTRVNYKKISRKCSQILFIH